MLSRLTRAEVTKFITVPSHLLTLAISTIALIVMAVALATAGDQPMGPIAPEPVALPMEYFAYVAMVLGVLIVTSDIGSGTYRITMSLMPQRMSILLAKYLAGGVIALLSAVVLLAVVVIGATLGGEVSLASQVSGENGGSLLAILAAVPLAALIGVAAGALLRSSAAAITVLLMWSLGVETVLVLVLPDRFAAYLPFKTIGSSLSTVGELNMGEGLGIFAAYAALLVIVAALVHSRRDSLV